MRRSAKPSSRASTEVGTPCGGVVLRTPAELAQHPGWYLSAQPAVLAEAGRILAGERWLLGHRFDVSPGRDWHVDPLSKRRWRRWPWPFIDVNHVVDGSDIRFPWELGRCQHQLKLAQAYVVSGDERYSSGCVSDMRDWLRSNPAGLGVNWTCAMEVALRACTWVAVRDLLRTSARWDAHWDSVVLSSLRTHREFVEENLEDWGMASQNHYVANVVGGLMVSLALAHEPSAEIQIQRWQEALESCMQNHVYADGTSFENSTSYHRLVLEMFTYAALALHRFGCALSPAFLHRLESMYEVAAACTRPDGCLADIGDNDEGTFLVLGHYFGRDSRDCRLMLALGGRLFGRPCLEQSGEGRMGQLAWVLDDCESPFSEKGAIASYPAKPGPVRDGSAARTRSRVFKEGGLYILRSPNIWALVNCAPTGVDGQGPHRHNDALALEACVKGRALLVDSGTYCYQHDPVTRRLFRGTRAHNTVMVDSEEQNPLEGLFALSSNRIHIKVQGWSSSAGTDELVASHTAYSGLAAGAVTHQREVRLDKNTDELSIVDVMSGSGIHDIEWNWHLAPGMEPSVQQCSPVSWRVDLPDIDMTLTMRPPAEPCDIGVILVHDEVSTAYRRLEPSHTLRLTVRGTALPIRASLVVAARPSSDSSSAPSEGR